jgi:putative ABC transport system permease protein
VTTRDLLYLVWSNLRRMKARVAMTAIGVVIGTASVIVLVSLAAGLQRNATESVGSIGDLTEINVFPGAFLTSFGAPPGQAGEEAVLDDRTLDELGSVPGVIAVTPREQLMGGGMLRLNRLTGGAQVVGIDPTQVEHLDFPLASGTDRLGRWQALVGARVAESFFDPRTGRSGVERRPAGVVVGGPPRQERAQTEPPNLQGQRLQLVLDRMGDDGRPVERIVRLRVAGVLKESGGQNDYTLYLALSDVLELNTWFTGQRLNPGRDGYTQALVKVASPEQVTAIQQGILERGFYAYSAGSALQGINTLFLAIQGIFAGIGAIALLVAAFGIANTMTMAIYERTREIGLMKAVGATNRDVMSVFLAEAGGIGLLGGLGGVLLGVALGGAVNLVGGTYLAAQAVQGGASASDLSFTLSHIPLWLPLFAVMFATLVGVVSGVYPAVRAASLSPITALKYE